MTTSKIRIWRQGVAVALAFFVVVFSPGFSCYTAVAASLEGGSSEGLPQETPGLEIPNPGSAVENPLGSSLENQDIPQADISAAPKSIETGLPAREEQERVHTADAKRAPGSTNSLELTQKETRAVLGQLPEGETLAVVSQREELVAPVATVSAYVGEKTQDALLGKKTPVLTTVAKIQKQIARLTKTSSSQILGKFLGVVYDGLIPGKRDQAPVVAEKKGFSISNPSALKPAKNVAAKAEKTAVPQPRPQAQSQTRTLAQRALGSVKDARVFYLAGAVATMTAVVFGAPAAFVVALAAGTGIIHGALLTRRLKIKGFVKGSFGKQAVLLSIAAALGFAGHSLVAPAAPLLYALSGSVAAVALSPSVDKTREIITSIKKTAGWIHSFWGGATNISKGVNVKKLFAAASVLAFVNSVLSLVPPRFYGEILQNLSNLAPAAAAAHPMIFMQSLAWCAAMMGIYGVVTFLSNIQSRFIYDVGNSIMKGLSVSFNSHVDRLPLMWHLTHSVGDVISTGTDATYTVQNTATTVVLNTITNGTLLVLSLPLMLYLSWPLTLIVVPALIIVQALPSGIYGRLTSVAYKLFYSIFKPLLAGYIEQKETNIETIKSAGKEDTEAQKMSEISHKTYMVGGGAIARANAPYRALSNGMANFVQAGLVLAGVFAVHAGVLTVAAATMFFFGAMFVRQSVQALCDNYISSKSAMGAAQKYDRIMAEPEEDYRENRSALVPTTSGRSIQFDHVSFGYNAARPILKEISFSAKAGQMIALVGESGSGKTTITRLLLDHLQPTEGLVRIDGRDLKDINLKDFRAHVGTILQEPNPFDDSVANNIKYLKQDASDAQIEGAAKTAGLHEDIVRMGYGHDLKSAAESDTGQKLLEVGKNSVLDKLYYFVLRLFDKESYAALAGDDKNDDARDEMDKALLSSISAHIVEARKILLGPDAPTEINPAKSIQDNISWGSGASFDDIVAAATKAGINGDIVSLGYNTRVGERGATLSGGQKQRLLLARLFLTAGHPWDIMILDEPTAALDGVTQQRIQDALEAARGKSTIVLVAHRLSTVQTADKIVVLGRGGSILEQGTHDELLHKNGVYSKLWQAQKLIDEAQQQAPKP